jgi:NAD(P)H dehydrogenase (quinone)
MRVLLVLAHPEPQSFCGALYTTAAEVLRAEGHEVRLSDLYADGFDPVGDRRDFRTTADPDFFKYQKEQLAAVAHGGFTEELTAEMEKLLWCELVIFCFPLWWFGVPAILKGWFDRILAMGFAYGGGRWFETGPLLGRRALLAITAGAPRERYMEGAIFGDIGHVLYPIHVGILNLVGIAALPPFIAWSPARRSAEERAALLAEWRGRLTGLHDESPLPMRLVADHPDPLAGTVGAYRL